MALINNTVKPILRIGFLINPKAPLFLALSIEPSASHE